MKSPNLSEQDPVAAIFEFPNQVEAVIRKIEESGFDLKKLSIVGKDYHTVEPPIGYYTIADRLIYQGKLLAFWSRLWKKLIDSASFFVPGVGPLLVAGPVGTRIDGVLEDAAMMGRMSALGIALVSIGIPKDSIRQYEENVKDGNFLLILHGTPLEAEHLKYRWNNPQEAETPVRNELVAFGA